MTEIIKAHEILNALQKKHTMQQQPWAFFAEVKTGPSYTGMLKLDAVAIKKSWTKPCIIGYEIKVSRRDFLNDDKWPGYLHYCHKFLFVCPPGIIDAAELPETVGLITCNPDTLALSTRKAAVMRPIELPVDMFLYLIMNRVGETHHPFFSSAREQLQEWLRDKENKKELGRNVSSNLIKRLRRLEDERGDMDRKLSRLADRESELKQVRAVMQKHGYVHVRYIAEEMDKALSMKGENLTPSMKHCIENLVAEYDRQKKLQEKLQQRAEAACVLKS